MNPIYSLKAIFTKQPVAIAGAIRSVLMVLVLVGLVVIDEKALAGIALCAELILGLFTWNSVTPTAHPRLEVGTEVEVIDSGGATVAIDPQAIAAGGH